MFVYNILVLVIISVMSVYDIKYKKIPTISVVMLLALSLIFGITFIKNNLLYMVIGMSLPVVVYVFCRIAKALMGIGDLLVLLSIGSVYGIINICIIMLIASISFVIFANVAILIKRINKKEALFFIPFVEVGTVISIVLQQI